KQTLLKKNPYLHHTFPHSPFSAVTANLGPASVSPPHADGGNKANGMCFISALGRFDADRGGHLVCWDYDLIIHFPAGCSALILSAVVTHSNTPIQDNEERYSLIQYSAGLLTATSLTCTGTALPPPRILRSGRRIARLIAQPL
ncbi:hypothetical protein B0H14DRAFT_2386466, partial [Mycena olivaceomarginata]